MKLTWLETPAPRPDLESRRESKYSFPHADVDALRAVLMRRGRRIEHAGPVSFVTSLYLDDDRLGACRANLDGVGVRHKTRLRWYDRILPGCGPVYLETKWRRHLVTGKHRRPFTSSEPIEEIGFRRLIRELRDGRPDESHDHLDRDDVPITLVRYRREHFVFAEGEVRATLDHDLEFISQFGRRRMTTAFPQRRPDFVLIEMKHAPGAEATSRALLRPLRTRARRFSKYVTACQSIGLATSL